MLVNRTGDQPDAAVGDGHCDTDDNPGNGDQCTLRAAIQETNATSANVIDFNLPPNSTIVLNTELEALTGMTMRGPGSGLLTIKRNPAPGTAHFRIFTVRGSAAVFMSGLTITNGRVPDGTLSPDGAPGGGIHNLGSLDFATSSSLAIAPAMEEMMMASIPVEDLEERVEELEAKGR